MEEISSAKLNYIRNTQTSRERSIRIEVVGEVSEAERHFLDGIALFLAGTMAKDDNKHTVYVAELMAKLIKYIVSRLQKAKEEGK